MKDFPACSGIWPTKNTDRNNNVYMFLKFYLYWLKWSTFRIGSGKKYEPLGSIITNVGSTMIMDPLSFNWSSGKLIRDTSLLKSITTGVIDTSDITSFKSTLKNPQ